MKYREVRYILTSHPERIGEIDPEWRDEYFTLLHTVCRINGALVHRFKDHQEYNVGGYTPLHHLAMYYPQYTPLLKWHELPDAGNFTPERYMRNYGSHSYVLAKLRRLFGTLPAAYIRLVHNYT